MDSTLKQNRQMRSMGIALGISTLAAVATMFVPASVLESITGASGLSELIPATAAPLGDTARALIAFGAGALTLAIMAVVLLRQSHDAPARNAAAAPAADMVDEDDRVFASSLKERVSRIALPKMPWVKDEDDITDLSDLPRLRGSDIHPDAPARRPLSAIIDLPVFDLTERVAEPITEVTDPVDFTDPDESVELVAPVEPEPIATPIAVEMQPTLAEMVAQLEASVAQRHQQLADLEAVATNLVAATNEPVDEAKFQSAAIQAEAPASILRPEWRPLGMVSKPEEEPDDMDEALAAALATLHRMNGTSR